MTLGDQFDLVLSAAQGGSEEAFAVLVDEFGRDVAGYLLAHEPGGAGELLDETWLHVRSALDRFRGDEAAFRRWVFGVARRRLIDFRMQRARRRTGDRDPPPTGEHAADALESLMPEELLDHIAALSPEQARALLLRIVAGLTPEEIAGLIGKRPKIVRALQQRALNSLEGHSRRRWPRRGHRRKDRR